MIERSAASLAAFFAVILFGFWVRTTIGRQQEALVERRDRLRAALMKAALEGEVDRSFGGARLLGASVACGAVAGFSLLGPGGLVFGAAAMPFALRAVVRSRRARHRARIDSCAADFAQTLASALSAGRSVRGALLASVATTPSPLAAELDRVVIDMTLGSSVHDALAGLRWRARSPRIDSLCGAIELHRGSGGDLVKLMRELSGSFRERDRALRDAHAASAQARFTAYVVAAIPVVVLALIELALPGSVSGALTLLPTAMMLGTSALLIAVGVLLSRRMTGSAD